ncbi:phospholipase D-like domain-containing protein [Sulfurimonas sp.]|uniref:phospholipase D-like domain-containing protein n=1 Tax=Sulfurimonas sp. TaxID=2022749 RepID=UPI0019EFEE23|nr:phospholipase D-like domain-containing protein [Sulfurimonas sp.]MBE0515129.1 DUF1669 domain-containing protein [Sulfurimonas sp.]
MKRLLFLLFAVVLIAKEQLFVHVPSPLPSSATNTSFGRELLVLIDDAKEEISFAIYGLRGQDAVLEALIRAKKRGVTIKAVVDSDSHGNNYYTDTHTLYKHFSVVSDGKSYIMHNKFFIIDRKTLWSGSANISDTGTGGYNANNAVTTDDKRVVSLYQEEFDEMFDEKKFSKKKNKRGYERIKTEDSIISVYFSPKSNTYEEGIKELIQNANEYIFIPIFYLTHKELSHELIRAKKRGVDVKVILDASAAGNKYSMHKKLREEGVEVKVENFGGKMHCKSMIVDDSFIVSGSMNFTKAGNSTNDENTLIIQNSALAIKYKNYFLELWQKIPDKQ